MNEFHNRYQLQPNINEEPRQHNISLNEEFHYMLLYFLGSEMLLTIISVLLLKQKFFI